MIESPCNDQFTKKETAVLQALESLAGVSGATAAAWEAAAVSAGVSRRTFYSARTRLMQAGVVSATEVRYSPVEPPLPPPVSTDDVAAVIKRESTRSRQAYLLYAQVPNDGRLQNLVRTVIAELPAEGLVKGHSPWTRTIPADVYEAGHDAVVEAVQTLIKPEQRSD